MSIVQQIATVISSIDIKWPGHTLTCIKRGFEITVKYKEKVESPSIIILPVKYPEKTEITIEVGTKKYTLRPEPGIIQYIYLYIDGSEEILRVTGKIGFKKEGLYRFNIIPSYAMYKPLAIHDIVKTVETKVYGKTLPVIAALAVATGAIAWRLTPIKFTEK